MGAICISRHVPYGHEVGLQTGGHNEVRAHTENVAVLFSLPTVTTIVVTPTGPTLVTNPLLSTVATPDWVEVQCPCELGIVVDAVRFVYQP